ncbi:MAG: hypothetical protein JSU70_00510, partial [Phycisphaerales bacterium]
TGGAWYDAGEDVWTVLGSGRDMWGEQDQLHYVYERLSGDGQITAQVTSIDVAHGPWSPQVSVLFSDMPDADSGGAGGDLRTVKDDSEYIWGGLGSLHYTYEPLSGNDLIAASVPNMVGFGEWMPAGLMIRETLDPDSRHAMMAVSPGYGAAFRWRPNTAEPPQSQGGGEATDVTPPVCLRIERRGDKFTGSYFSDGEWVRCGTATIPMERDVYVGIAVASQDEGQLTRATFDTSCPISAADVFDYGQINFVDFSFLANQWLEELPLMPHEP